MWTAAAAPPSKSLFMNVQTRSLTQTFRCFTFETGSGIYLFFPIQLIFFTAGLIISKMARVTFRRTIKITFIIDHHPPEPPPPSPRITGSHRQNEMGSRWDGNFSPSPGWVWYCSWNMNSPESVNANVQHTSKTDTPLCYGAPNSS